MRRALSCRMPVPSHDESWTIPLHILIWTTLSLGLIAVLVVVLLA